MKVYEVSGLHLLQGNLNTGPVPESKAKLRQDRELGLWPDQSPLFNVLHAVPNSSATETLARKEHFSLCFQALAVRSTSVTQGGRTAGGATPTGHGTEPPC